jgi:hypothetical protein
MIAVGLLLVLVGFVMLIPRGGMPGSASTRNVTLGTQRFSTPGRQGVQSTRFRVIQILMGVVVLAAGIILIATST